MAGSPSHGRVAEVARLWSEYGSRTGRGLWLEAPATDGLAKSPGFGARTGQGRDEDCGWKPQPRTGRRSRQALERVRVKDGTRTVAGSPSHGRVAEVARLWSEYGSRTGRGLWLEAPATDGLAKSPGFGASTGQGRDKDCGWKPQPRTGRRGRQALERVRDKVGTRTVAGSPSHGRVGEVARLWSEYGSRTGRGLCWKPQPREEAPATKKGTPWGPS